MIWGWKPSSSIVSQSTMVRACRICRRFCGAAMIDELLEFEAFKNDIRFKKGCSNVNLQLQNKVWAERILWRSSPSNGEDELLFMLCVGQRGKCGADMWDCVMSSKLFHVKKVSRARFAGIFVLLAGWNITPPRLRGQGVHLSESIRCKETLVALLESLIFCSRHLLDHMKWIFS